MSASNGMTQKPRFSVAITTPAYMKLINDTLADPERTKRFIASITSAVAVNPALQECEAPSIVAGALLGESLNLSPSPQLGQYYLVPFEVKLRGPDGKIIYKVDEYGNKLKDRNGRWIAESVKNAQFILGYKGYLQLAIRSGQYVDLDVLDIKAGEYLGKDRFTGRPRFEFIEDDDMREALPVVGYMACFEYINGFKKVLYWPKRKMLSHADRFSPAFSASAYEKLQNNEIPEDELWKYSSFWYKDFDMMARKTLLRQLIGKWGIMSTEMQKAFDSDNSEPYFSEDGQPFTPATPPIVPEDTGDTPDMTDDDSQPEGNQGAEKVNIDDL